MDKYTIRSAKPADADGVLHLEKKKKAQPYIIFLSGASGAGKTTLVDALNKKLDDPVSAFKDNGFSNYKIVLAHCDNSIRHKRLDINRNQPELINEDMDNWSNFLKKQALEMNAPILDTTIMNKETMVECFLKYIKNND